MYYLVKVKFSEDVFSKSKGITEKITTEQFLVEDTSVSGAEKRTYDYLDGYSNFEVSSVSESKITSVVLDKKETTREESVVVPSSVN